MINEKSIKYNQNKKGTRLFVKFGYKADVNEGKLDKEGILRRLGYEERREYLEKYEKLILTSENFANKDHNGWERSAGFKIDKNNLTVKIKVTTKEEIPRKYMFDVEAFDNFIAKGEHPENKYNN